jgi:hypothetical protein
MWPLGASILKVRSATLPTQRPEDASQVEALKGVGRPGGKTPLRLVCSLAGRFASLRSWRPGQPGSTAFVQRIPWPTSKGPQLAFEQNVVPRVARRLARRSDDAIHFKQKACVIGRTSCHRATGGGSIKKSWQDRHQRVIAERKDIRSTTGRNPGQSSAKHRATRGTTFGTTFEIHKGLWLCRLRRAPEDRATVPGGSAYTKPGAISG